jgi:hypothetical protein
VGTSSWREGSLDGESAHLQPTAQHRAGLEPRVVAVESHALSVTGLGSAYIMVSVLLLHVQEAMGSILCPEAAMLTGILWFYSVLTRKCWHSMVLEIGHNFLRARPSHFATHWIEKITSGRRSWSRVTQEKALFALICTSLHIYYGRVKACQHGNDRTINTRNQHAARESWARHCCVCGSLMLDTLYAEVMVSSPRSENI